MAGDAAPPSPSTRAPVSPNPVLYAYSRHVLPTPDDWGDEVCVSGYWFLDEPGWTAPPELDDFLGSGPAPVYVGFGSMPGVEPEQMSRRVIEALGRLGLRGILATGGGALRRVPCPETILFVDSAPHDQLFRKVRATLHHGGAGTTAATLRAGKPMASLPFFGDQPFWARRAAILGVAAPPLKRPLSVEQLCDALGHCEQTHTRRRAEELGHAVRAENGTARASDFIETWPSRLA